MINKGKIQVGDMVLYRKGNTIKEWEVNAISPSETYVEVENDDHFARWIKYTEILEIMETESGEIPSPEEEIIVVPEKPIVRPRTSDFVKHEV